LKSVARETCASIPNANLGVSRNSPCSAPGFQAIRYATITISGIELAEKIKKAQFKTGKLAGRSATAPAIWVAVLAA